MSYPSLEGKTFIVTGAASGMGRALSILLARQKANVGLFDLNKPDAVAAEIQRAGGKALSIKVDVTDVKNVNEATNAVLDHFGSLDGAANMAGYVGNQGMTGTGYALENIQDKDWDMMLDINLNGVKNCLRAQLKNMKGPGAIINAASIAGQMGTPYNTPYGVSKWGVINLTKSAAQEAGPKGIRVNAVAPGIVNTALAKALGSAEAVNAALVSRTALKRIGEPEDVADVIVFLLSDQARYISGAVINVDAGFA